MTGDIDTSAFYDKLNVALTLHQHAALTNIFYPYLGATKQVLSQSEKQKFAKSHRTARLGTPGNDNFPADTERTSGWPWRAHSHGPYRRILPLCTNYGVEAPSGLRRQRRRALVAP